jgi:amidase
MARSVADAALLLGAMTGSDERDPATAASPAPALTDYSAFLKPDGLQGLRLGVARDYFGFDERVDALMEDCLKTLQAAGAVLVDPVKITAERLLGPSEVTVLLYEFKTDLTSYLSSAGPDVQVRSLADVIAFNEAHKERVMPYFGQERMLAAQKKGNLTSAGYLRALEKGQRLTRQSIDAAIADHQIDAIVAPTGGPAWLIDLVNGDQYTGGGFSSPAAISGYPHITVPAGYIWGLPIGLSFFGPAWSEARLIQAAYAFEQAMPARKPPQYLPTVQF